MAVTDRKLLERIWAAVAAIPRGRVASYGAIARRAGAPRRARFVGHALKVAPARLKLPWHRVLNAQGRISLPPGSRAHRLQRRLLEAEGVRFSNGRVERAARGDDADLDAFLWRPRD
ncbi:MAG: methylated-DNA--[protein]-cysteine S-methyltransferase [Steroidobacteraceae bacterium]|nr:methylated-DNA--[protein]-cysteine S-methyltransferase [Steroidobacteraceae bacterium]